MPKELLAPHVVAKPFPWEALWCSRSRQVFLAHSAHDVHFAGRVRLALQDLEIRGWLAEAELKPGDWLFESIQEACRRSFGLLVLLTPYALSSAWVYTEVRSWINQWKDTADAHASNPKPLCLLLDASDPDLTTIFAAWNETNPGHFDQNSKPLEKLRQRMKREHALTQSRLDKYVSSAQGLFRCLEPTFMRDERVSIAFYPHRPLDWRGSAVITHFTDVMDHWGLTKSKPAGRRPESPGSSSSDPGASSSGR
jgi:hypothetical protein